VADRAASDANRSKLQVACLIPSDQPAKALGRRTRPGGFCHLNSRTFLAACLFIASCATLPPKDLIPHLNDNGAKGVQLLNFGQFSFARYISYLPGKMDAKDLPVERFSVNNNYATIHIELRGADEQTKNMAVLTANDLLAVRDALNDFLPFTMNRLRLRVVMIPDGFRYVKTKTVIFRASNVSAEFAVRMTTGAATSRRLVIRDIAHELMHVMLSINGVTSKDAKSDGGSVEEETIYTMENCVELRITGSTDGDPLADQNNGFDASGLVPSNAVTSLVSGQHVDAVLAELFAQDAGPITSDDPRAEKLEALCRDAIDRLVAATHG